MRFDLDIKRHPVCQVKGCEKLQAGGAIIELKDLGATEVRVCIQHLREINGEFKADSEKRKKK